MSKFNPSVLEYLGRIDHGVLALISFMYNDEYYEGTFFYTKDGFVLTISEELEEVLGHDIGEDPEKEELIREIQDKISPYNEIYPNLNNI